MNVAENILEIRKDFPIFSRVIDGKKLVYLDSAATSQRPLTVVEATSQYYLYSNANVHRGVYRLSQEATDRYEEVRLKTAHFLGTDLAKEIIFTKGTTESINLITSSWGNAFIEEGDVIAVTRMEHHANFVPWQQLAKNKRARFEIVELDNDLRINEESFLRVLALKPKVFAMTWMSNVTGVKNDLATYAQRAKKQGALVVLDAAQGAAHLSLKREELVWVDFIAFSTHKLCGPTGVGILWGRASVLEKMKPYQYGGNMISLVEDFDSQWNELPHCFEAGTPNIAGIYGWGAALDYLQKIGMSEIQKYEHAITEKFLDLFQNQEGIQVYGPKVAEQRGPVFSIALQSVHAHDLATFLDSEGISVRAGHHCAHPLMAHLKMPSTCRASFSFYNTFEEVELLSSALVRCQKYFDRRGGQERDQKGERGRKND